MAVDLRSSSEGIPVYDSGGEETTLHPELAHLADIIQMPSPLASDGLPDLEVPVLNEAETVKPDLRTPSEIARVAELKVQQEQLVAEYSKNSEATSSTVEPEKYTPAEARAHRVNDHLEYAQNGDAERQTAQARAKIHELVDPNWNPYNQPEGERPYEKRYPTPTIEAEQVYVTDERKKDQQLAYESLQPLLDKVTELQKASEAENVSSIERQLAAEAWATDIQRRLDQQIINGAERAVEGIPPLGENQTNTVRFLQELGDRLGCREEPVKTWVEKVDDRSITHILLGSNNPKVAMEQVWSEGRFVSGRIMELSRPLLEESEAAKIVGPVARAGHRGRELLDRALDRWANGKSTDNEVKERGPVGRQLLPVEELRLTTWLKEHYGEQLSVEARGLLQSSRLAETRAMPPEREIGKKAMKRELQSAGMSWSQAAEIVYPNQRRKPSKPRWWEQGQAKPQPRGFLASLLGVFTSR